MNPLPFEQKGEEVGEVEASNDNGGEGSQQAIEAEKEGVFERRTHGRIFKGTPSAGDIAIVHHDEILQGINGTGYFDE